MKIEKSIPIPDRTRCKYPFGEMEIGDSLLIKGANMKGKEYSAARIYGGRTSRKFTAYPVDDGIRIWRIA